MIINVEKKMNKTVEKQKLLMEQRETQTTRWAEDL